MNAQQAREPSSYRIIKILFLDLWWYDKNDVALSFSLHVDPHTQNKNLVEVGQIGINNGSQSVNLLVTLGYILGVMKN